MLENSRVIASIETQTDDGHTALHLACIAETHASVLPLLLQAGADPTAIIRGDVGSHIKTHCLHKKIFPRSHHAC